MKRWRAEHLALAGAAVLLAAIPAFGQQDDEPESLLPPGFDDPQPQPEPEPERNQTTPAPRPGPAPAPPGAPIGPDGELAPEDAAAEDLEALQIDPITSGIELP